VTRHETLCKISYYEWLLENTKLNPKHELWILDQLSNLRAIVASSREAHA
jgi:hypothetical protein